MAFSVVYNIKKENELRFSALKTPVRLEVVSGRAEIFGFDLVRNKGYMFPPYTSSAVFSWEGCQVKLGGEIKKPYLSSDSVIKSHARRHAYLEEKRQLAAATNESGPVCLVLGPAQSGKTSLCKLLLNYAVKQGWRPLYVDLNVNNSTLSLPGVVGVLPVRNQLAATDGLDSLPRDLSVFNFGHLRPRRNAPLYYVMLKHLGELLHSRLGSADPKVRESGIVIDTCEWIRRKGYLSLKLAVSVFRVDIVFVLRNETLFQRFREGLPNTVQVVFVPLHDGVSRRPRRLRNVTREYKVWEHFYCPRDRCQFEVNFSEVQIYRAKPPLMRVGLAVNPSEAGMGDLEVVSVPVRKNLENRILGVSHAVVFNERMIVTSLKSFVCVVEVNMRKKVMTVLSPQPGPLQSNILILSDIKLKPI